MGRCFRFLNLMLLSCVLSLRHFCEDGTQIFSCPSESTVICGHNAPACMALSCVVSLHIANRATNRQRFARNMLTCPNVQSNPSSPGRILQVMMIFCFGVETQTNITSAFSNGVEPHCHSHQNRDHCHIDACRRFATSSPVGDTCSQVRYGCGEVKSLRLGMPFIQCSAFVALWSSGQMPVNPIFVICSWIRSDRMSRLFNSPWQHQCRMVFKLLLLLTMVLVFCVALLSESLNRCCFM